MKTTMYIATIGLALAWTLPAQSKSLLYVSRYNSTSLDGAAGVLGDAGPFDITGVTPGTNATSFPLLPAAGVSAMIGDPDNDGVLAEFTGLPHASFGITGLFIKDKDRQSGDASNDLRSIVHRERRFTNSTSTRSHKKARN